MGIKIVLIKQISGMLILRKSSFLRRTPVFLKNVLIIEVEHTYKHAGLFLCIPAAIVWTTTAAMPAMEHCCCTCALRSQP